MSPSPNPQLLCNTEHAQWTTNRLDVATPSKLSGRLDCFASQQQNTTWDAFWMGAQWLVGEARSICVEQGFDR